jgi:hypothetical protein
MPREYFIVLFAGGIAVWIIIFFFVRFTNKSVVQYFRKLTEKYGVKVDESKKIGIGRFPMAEGTYRGYPLFIGCMKKGEEGEKCTHTFIRLICNNPTGLVFRIVCKNKQNTMEYGKFALKINDSEFEEKFIVNTNNPEFMISLLDFNIKYKLLQASNLGFSGEITLDNENLLYTEPELIRNDVVMLRSEVMIHVLTDIADSLKILK